MPKLHLSEGANRILTRLQDRTPPREGARLLVYSLPNVVTNEDVESLCQVATEIYQLNEAGDEYQDSTFIIPAPLNRRLPGRNVQEILDAHIASLDDFTHGNDANNPNDDSIFPFAFVVIESAEWRKHGATVVFLGNATDSDDDENESEQPSKDIWWVDECEMSVVALVGVCQEIIMELDDWSIIRECQGRPTARMGDARYLSTRSRSWSPQNISSEMRRWDSG